MCASKVADGAQRGWIVPIGGAENKDNSPQILRRFVGLAGGEAARIVVVPTASQLRDTGPRYERLFRELGAGQATALDFDTRRDAEEPGRMEVLQAATGVFFTGGNQLRLSTLIGGTPIAKSVRMMNAAGVPVAGTSAGAAFICEHMIAFGDEGSTPIAGSVRLAPGLGLTNRFVIDQHFRQRDRLGRLSPRWPTTRLPSASAWTRTRRPSSRRTTPCTSKVRGASRWSTPPRCSSARWRRSTKAARCACWA